MKKYKKMVQIAILSTVLLVGAVTVVNAMSKPSQEVKVGSIAPEFSLVGLDGDAHKLSDYKGKSVVLNFWGTYCPPCVREMPALQNQFELRKNENVEIIGVNLNESVVTVKAFLQQYQISFPILLDKDEVRKQYKVKSYPTTFYIDSNGIIKDIFVGEMTEKDIATRIDNILR